MVMTSKSLHLTQAGIERAKGETAKQIGRRRAKEQVKLDRQAQQSGAKGTLVVCAVGHSCKVEYTCEHHLLSHQSETSCVRLCKVHYDEMCRIGIEAFFKNYKHQMERYSSEAFIKFRDAIATSDTV